MDKCSPVEMRKNLEIVERYRAIGIDFVAVPVMDSSHKCQLIAQSNEVLEYLAREMED